MSLHTTLTLTTANPHSHTAVTFTSSHHARYPSPQTRREPSIDVIKTSNNTVTMVKDKTVIRNALQTSELFRGIARSWIMYYMDEKNTNNTAAYAPTPNTATSPLCVKVYNLPKVEFLCQSLRWWIRGEMHTQMAGT
ncbi:hypothetical protein N7527_001355 [Penicillium freii]|nr:hypothetical protein N7527_001355 [Penicillium freii]